MGKILKIFTFICSLGALSGAHAEVISNPTILNAHTNEPYSITCESNPTAVCQSLGYQKFIQATCKTVVKLTFREVAEKVNVSIVSLLCNGIHLNKKVQRQQRCQFQTGFTSYVSAQHVDFGPSGELSNQYTVQKRKMNVLSKIKCE